MNKTFALVDQRISDKCFRALCDHGFFPIKLRKMDILPSPISSHADILAFKLGNTLFFSKSYFEQNNDILSPLNPQNILLTKASQGSSYPLDAIFNGLVMKNTLFCKRDSFSEEIIGKAEDMQIKIVNVKQGYPACTTLKISENAIVTADRGMARALEGEGISVLLIENGGVLLPPYEYGFIGGAAGAYGDEIFFFGDLKLHPDAERISEFIERNGKRVISLSDEPLCDLGGIIFVN